MKKIFFLAIIAFACFSWVSCVPTCELPSATFGVKLTDKTTGLPLIVNGLYHNDSIRIYRHYLCGEYGYPCGTNEILPYNSQVYPKSDGISYIYVRAGDICRYIIHLDSTHSDSVRFECKEGTSKDCLDCVGYYNNQVLCQNCEDIDSVFTIQK